MLAKYFILFPKVVVLTFEKKTHTVGCTWAETVIVSKSGFKAHTFTLK